MNQLCININVDRWLRRHGEQRSSASSATRTVPVFAVFAPAPTLRGEGAKGERGERGRERGRRAWPSRERFILYQFYYIILYYYYILEEEGRGERLALEGEVHIIPALLYYYIIILL